MPGLPESAWRTAVALQNTTRGVVAQAVSFLRSAAFKQWRRRPLDIQMDVTPPQLMLIAPPIEGAPRPRGITPPHDTSPHLTPTYPTSPRLTPPHPASPRLTPPHPT